MMERLAMADFVDGIRTALQAGEELALATVVGVEDGHISFLGRKLLMHKDGSVEGSVGSEAVDRRIETDCRQVMIEGPTTQLIEYALTGEESEGLGIETGAALKVFIERLKPSPTLLIVGAGHIAQPLCRIGKMLGFEVVVLDDRVSFANRQRFPEADRVIAEPFGETLRQFPITTSTYIVLVTRGHAHDEQALQQVIASNAAYVGMIGSKRHSREVLRRMAAQGFPNDAIERVYTPIGLDIGAQTPEEIAVSIMAEVVNARHRNKRHPSSLSGRKELKADA